MMKVCLSNKRGRAFRRDWFAFAAITLFISVGCGGGNDAPKTSLHEHDHHVAPHWPSDLADVAVKIRERLSAPTIGETQRSEIGDLVSWTAEVAADTNLPEADWVPIYHATESLTANLRSAGPTLSDQNRSQLELLCELIDQSAGKIPEQLPNLVKAP